MLWAVFLQMEAFMKVLDAIKKVFDKILEVLGIICLTIMTIMIVYQVIARYVFNNPSAVSEALAQFLFVWMIMFGSAYVYDILKDKFPPKMNLVVNILTNICLFLFVMLICVKGGYRYTVGQVKQIDAALHISKSIMYASVPFTGIITMYYAVYNTIRDVLNYKEGKRKLSDPLGGTA